MNKKRKTFRLQYPPPTHSWPPQYLFSLQDILHLLGWIYHSTQKNGIVNAGYQGPALWVALPWGCLCKAFSIILRSIHYWEKTKGSKDLAGHMTSLKKDSIQKKHDIHAGGLQVAEGNCFHFVTWSCSLTTSCLEPLCDNNNVELNKWKSIEKPNLIK